MNKAILIEAEDWEGLFVNGNLVKEGHTLNEGTSRVKYMIALANKFDFNLDELIETYIDAADEEYLNDYGSFPNQLSDLLGSYNTIDSFI